MKVRGAVVGVGAWCVRVLRCCKEGACVAVIAGGGAAASLCRSSRSPISPHPPPERRVASDRAAGVVAKWRDAPLPTFHPAGGDTAPRRARDAGAAGRTGRRSRARYVRGPDRAVSTTTQLAVIAPASARRRLTLRSARLSAQPARLVCVVGRRAVGTARALGRRRRRPAVLTAST